MRTLWQLKEAVNRMLWSLELKQYEADLHAANAYRDGLKDLYNDWLKEVLDELANIEDEDGKSEYIVLALLSFGERVKELQRKRLLEAFDLGLAGDPASPEALVELAEYIELQESYVDDSLIPGLEEHFLGRLHDMPEIGQEAFEESLSKRAYRVGLYAVGFWAVLQAAQAWISSPGRRCTWHLQPLADHCPDCPELAGEWTAATLPTKPGWGDTECGPGCRCWLIWEDPLEIW